jgi:hypothetical protein
MPWSEVITREQEVLGVNKNNIIAQAFVPDSSGYVKTKKIEDPEYADISADLLIFQTLQRRAVAYELAELCPYDTFSNLGKKLMKEYSKPAGRGTGRLA